VTELAPIIAPGGPARFPIQAPISSSITVPTLRCAKASTAKRRILDIVRRETGNRRPCPPAPLVVEALNALGIKKLVIVSPYQDNEVIVAYLQILRLHGCS